MSDEPNNLQAIANDLAGWPDQKGMSRLNNLPLLKQALGELSPELMATLRLHLAAEEFMIIETGMDPNS